MFRAKAWVANVSPTVVVTLFPLQAATIWTDARPDVIPDGEGNIIRHATNAYQHLIRR
jgi:hypothetical protein